MSMSARGGSSARKSDIKIIEPNEVFPLHMDVTGVKLDIEWFCPMSSLADLDVYVLLYDENSRFIQKLNIDHPLSADGSFRLEADMDAHEDSNSHKESVYVSFKDVDVKTAAAVLFVDGGPRNFQYISTVAVTCFETIDNTAESGRDMMKKLESSLNARNNVFFRSQCPARKDFQGIAAVVIYKDGWHPDDSPKFSCCPTLEAVYLPTSREKDEYCQTVAVNSVPCLHKYRPRLFPSVKSICAALSSTSLPKLKRSFLAGKGLPKGAFTEVLFQQLFLTQPELLELTEAAYTVAMLHELFGQIDFNGDGAVDWDEFTTFCIHTGLIGTHDNSGSASEGDTTVGAALNSYVVEYKEDILMKDTVLSTYSPLVVLRHAPTIKRLLVLQEKREACLMLDEQFHLIATLNPSKVLGLEEKEEKFKIYDMCYIPFKDMYALVTSDHSLTVYREHMAQSGRKCTYSVFNRVHFTFLQTKIIFSSLTNIICTVDCNNTISGWRIDGKETIFEVSRHKAFVTDMISIDKHNLFATCSLDRRVVLWSQTTRRVKGVLLGHKRGITRMSYGRDTLLTSGFECEARTWDLNLKEPQLILKGHRLPISDSKVMCNDNTLDADLRAITVDDSGEFRLWSIGLTEGNENSVVDTLQIFSLNGSVGSAGKIVTKFSCILLPFDPHYSNTNYSNIIAGSSKLTHFKPEKSTKEFLPPNCMLYSDINACLITGVGKSVFKYDVFTGGFQNSFDAIEPAEITCFVNDGKEGRRLFLGFSDGAVVLLNFASGQVLSRARAHSKSITALTVRNDSTGAILYAGSIEGKLRTLVEHGGDLDCHSTLDETFRKDQAAISYIRVVPEVKLLLMAASSNYWGGWNCITLKSYFTIEEVEPVTGVELLGGGGVYNRGSMIDFESAMKMEFEKVVTVAVCNSSTVRIYSIDTLNVKAVCSHVLIHPERLYFSRMVTLNYPQSVSMNYSGKLSQSYKEMIVVSSDEGKLVTWDVRDIRDKSLSKFYLTYPNLLEMVKMLIPYQENGMTRVSSSVTLTGEHKKDCGAENKEDDGNLKTDAYDLDKLPAFLRENSCVDSVSSYDSDSSECDGDSVDSENTLESQDSMFSMTSKMGVVVDDLGEGSQAVGIAKTFSIESPIDTSASLKAVNDGRFDGGDTKKLQNGLQFSPVKKKSKQKRHHLHRADTKTTIAISKDDILPDTEESASISSAFSWRAHTDVIQNMVSLHDDSCIITNSLDGFHRVWNLHQECLGEMALPNLTEKMQLRQKENKQAWKFILEKIPVLPMHEKIAKEFIGKLQGTDDGRFDKVKSRRAGLATTNEKQKKALRMMTVEDKRRSFVLRSMGGSKGSMNGGVLEAINDDNESLQTIGQSGTTKEGRQKSKGLFAEDVVDDQSGLKISAANVEQDNKIGSESRISFSDSTKFADDGNGDDEMSAPSFRKSDSMSTLQSSKNLISARCCKKKTKYQSEFDKKMASVFGDEQLWNDPEHFVANSVSAFSESSIASSHHSGYIDEEGHAILRRLQKDRDKLDVYQRSQPRLVLKNIGMCTSIEYPSSDMSNSELSFGSQKLMYKNANLVISEKTKMTDRAKQNARHALAKARIQNSSASVGKLVEFVEKPVHSIALPALTEADEGIGNSLPPVINVLEASRQSRRRSGIVAMKLDSAKELMLSSSESSMSLPPPPKKLDRIRISQYIGRVMDAEDGSITQWEKDVQTRQNNERHFKLRQKKRRNRRKPSEKRHTVAATERRLGTTIKHFFAVRGQLKEEEKEARMPTAKELLPSYTVADVRNFLDTFQRVDVDMSGTLDVNEWVEFLSGENNRHISKSQARKMFNNVDMSSQGVLSVKDLVPIVFSKADKQQIEVISNFLEEQIAKEGLQGREGVTTMEMESLFESYDADHIGYISVRLLRDRIKSLKLPVTASATVSASFSDFEDDELLNMSEFLRVFHTFISAM